MIIDIKHLLIPPPLTPITLLPTSVQMVSSKLASQGCSRSYGLPNLFITGLYCYDLRTILRTDFSNNHLFILFSDISAGVGGSLKYQCLETAKV